MCYMIHTITTPNVQLTKKGELFEDPERYRKLVGKLNYLIVTHLDIAYSVSVLSRYMSSPTLNHWGSCRAYPMLLERSP